MTAPLVRGYRVSMSAFCYLTSCGDCTDVTCGCGCHSVADTTVDWTPADETASYIDDDARAGRTSR